LRVLFLTHRLPYAPNRGDRVRAFFLLKCLSRVATVDVVSLAHDAEEAAQAPLLASAASVRVARVHRRRALARGAIALPTSSPLTHVLLDSPELGPAIESAVQAHRPDVVLAYCSSMARCAFSPPLTAIPFILDMVDVDSAKWKALARTTPPPMRWVYDRESRCLSSFEARAAKVAFASTVVTPLEAETLQVIAPLARIEVVPNGVDVESLVPNGPASTTRSVVFCGVMNYPPNAAAARLLAADVWPFVRRRHPDATLTIVGSHPTRAVLALANAAQGIVVTGAVPDVRPYLWSAAIAAAPIVTARGIQNKVLEAVAAGLPTVVTPNIMDALPSQVTAACTSADGVNAIAEAIGNLLSKSPEERRATVAKADVRSLTWERQLEPFHRLIEQAAMTGRERS
jgi:sugar transferase (PEP-CTERM/EpsH1 system associated)